MNLPNPSPKVVAPRFSGFAPMGKLSRPYLVEALQGVGVKLPPGVVKAWTVFLEARTARPEPAPDTISWSPTLTGEWREREHGRLQARTVEAWSSYRKSIRPAGPNIYGQLQARFDEGIASGDPEAVRTVSAVARRCRGHLVSDLKVKLPGIVWWVSDLAPVVEWAETNGTPTLSDLVAHFEWPTHLNTAEEVAAAISTYNRATTAARVAEHRAQSVFL